MIVQNSFLNKLKDFGLNIYESKLWTALLSRGISTAGELSDIANIPRSRSYDVLESLERKGFIILKLGKPIKYMAVPPEEVLERVKKKIRNDAQKQVTAMEELRESEVLDELQLLHKQGVEYVEPTELTGSIQGRSHLYDQAEMSIKAAEESIFIMVTPEGLIRDIASFKQLFEKVAKRGVRIRIATSLTKECYPVVEELGDLVDIRHIEHIQARFIIVDGREILFMLLDDRDVHPTYDVGIWVNTAFFAKAMEGLIDEVWEKMPRAKDLLVTQK